MLTPGGPDDFCLLPHALAELEPRSVFSPHGTIIQTHANATLPLSAIAPHPDASTPPPYKQGAPLKM